MATGAIGSLLPKLGLLLNNEYDLQKGVKEKIGHLSRELKAAKTPLTIIGDVPWDELNPQVRLWARDVREASYDMEDIIDTFLVRVVGAPPGPTEPRVFGRLKKNMGSLFQKSKARRKISKLTQDISDKLNEVEARRDRYKVVDSIAAMSSASVKKIDPRLLNVHKSVKEFVGLEGPMDDLINKLSLGSDEDESDTNIKIVALVGIGGLGKTTLAKAVYEKLKSHFECGAFVTVGQNPDTENVFRDILIGLDKRK
ncbi:hypothetical protein U9M48_042148 [Paspalum notatum var. saurae]|uniref:Uncharacterized protein n=1 Tax=Paspalum notatum var. saurae TaxID=547442 RepID=A0AAQ3US91_PASNO